MLQPWFVVEFILSILSTLRVFCRSRCDTALEVLALRQQVAVLKRKRPRPPLNSLDRLFWTLLHRCWSRWPMFSSSSSPKPSSAGTARASASTGVGDPARGAVARRSTPRFAP